jgi:hypothetical protein
MLREDSLPVEVTKKAACCTADYINNGLDCPVSEAYRWMPLQALACCELEKTSDDAALARSARVAHPHTTQEEVENCFDTGWRDWWRVWSWWRKDGSDKRAHQTMRRTELQQLPKLALVGRTLTHKETEKGCGSFCDRCADLWEMP